MKGYPRPRVWFEQGCSTVGVTLSRCARVHLAAYIHQLLISKSSFIWYYLLYNIFKMYCYTCGIKGKIQKPVGSLWNSWSTWLDAGLQRTLGGVGMSRQRLPVEKECWCPAELILAGRKEKMWKVRERGRRRKDGKGRSQGLGRNGKACCRKNPLPIQAFLSNFHLLSLHGSRVFSFSLVVQPVSVQLSRHLELMRQLYHLIGEVLLNSFSQSARPSARLSLESWEDWVVPFSPLRAIYVETNTFLGLCCLWLDGWF